MEVTVKCDDVIKFFKNVTKVQTFLAFDMFENTIVIYQGRKKTTFKEYEIIGFEVKEGDKLGC